MSSVKRERPYLLIKNGKRLTIDTVDAGVEEVVEIEDSTQYLNLPIDKVKDYSKSVSPQRKSDLWNFNIQMESGISFTVRGVETLAASQMERMISKAQENGQAIEDDSVVIKEVLSEDDTFGPVYAYVDGSIRVKFKRVVLPAGEKTGKLATLYYDNSRVMEITDPSTKEYILSQISDDAVMEEEEMIF